MATTWEVGNGTATYKVDGKVVATITGLNKNLTKSDYITVSEDSNGGVGTIKLASNVLADTKVELKLENGGNYVLAFDGYVPNGEPENPKMSFAEDTKKDYGIVTVTGDLKAKYTLAKNGKSITYTAPKSGQTLATITGLNTVLSISEDKEKAGIVDGNGNFTPEVTLIGDTITLSDEALNEKNVTLANKNGATYTLAFDGTVGEPQFDNGSWSEVTKKGDSTYTADVGESGYTLSLDGKTVTFTASGDDKVLAMISGIANTTDITFKEDSGSDALDAKNNRTIVLPASALAQKAVTVKGEGFLLELDRGVSQDSTATDNVWAISGTKATYKTITPEYYTYDAAKNQVNYTKPKDITTLATLNGTKKVQGDVTAASVGEGINVTGNVITLNTKALGTSNVTLTNGKDSTGTATNYSLALAGGISAPGVATGSYWKTSGTIATLMGKTTEGYLASNSTTINYVSDSTKDVAIVTVKGLAKGVVANDEGDAVGIKDSNGDVVDGLSEADGVITVSANVLGTSNATINPTAGYVYSFALDNGRINDGGAVNIADDTKKTFWYVKGKKLLLKNGTARYYKITDPTTVTQYDATVDKDVATVSGLVTGLKVVDGEIDGIDVSGNKITLSKKVLNNANVSLVTSNGSGYKLYLNSNENLTVKSNKTFWTVKGTTATLNLGTTDGYTGDGTTELTYNKRQTTETLAIITGLEKGLKVGDDDKIEGIEAEEYSVSAATTPKTIKLDESVLGTTDVELDSKGKQYGYSFEIDDESKAVVESAWRAGEGKKAGTAYYDINTTTAGFEPNDDDTALIYKEKGTVTTTVTGLKIANEKTVVSGLSKPDDNGVITVSTDSLGESNVKLTDAKGSDYTLKLAKGIKEPTASNYNWVPDEKSKTKATLYGDVGVAGYKASTDGKSIAYTPEGDGGELATITGLKSGITSAELNAGIVQEGSELKLSNSVLGSTNLSVTGGVYTLALDSQVDTEAKQRTNWVTSGTTANYKTYLCGYYTLDAKGTSIKFTKPTAGTTHATVKGIKKDVDLNSLSVFSGTASSGLLTLSNAQLDTAKKTTLTGSGFTLELANEVQQEAKTELEWVVSGTTANYTNHVIAYYTQSGNTVTYHAPTKGTIYATVSGIKSGLENFSQYVSNAGVITLGEDQLAQKKVTLKGDGYTLALGTISAENFAEPLGTYWIQKKGKTQADYNQDFDPGYALSDDAKTITYAKKMTTKTLATLKGIAAPEEAVDTRTPIKETVNGKEVITGYTYKNGDKLSDEISVSGSTINVSADGFAVQKDGSVKDGSNVTLTTNYDYKLAALTEPAKNGDPNWLIVRDKKENPTGKLSYQQEYKVGHTLSKDAKTLTYSAAKAETLATLSGLDKAVIAEEFGTAETISTDDLEEYGISVSEKNITLAAPENDDYGNPNPSLLLNGKITLDKKDTYSLTLDSSVLPALDGYKWTVSGTKATYSESLSDGYKRTDIQNVAYVKAALGDTLVTLNGLKKGLKVGEDAQGNSIIGILDSNKKVVKGINLTNVGENQTIGLTKDVLGTTDITLTNGDGQKFVFDSDQFGGNEPGSLEESWTYSKGTATFKAVQNSGYTLGMQNASDTGYNKVTYTAAKTTTLATVKGLNKNFVGNLESAIVDSGTSITVNKELLTTGNVTLTLPKNAETPYSLVIGDAPQQALNVTEWVTSGTTANLKKYDQAYYTIDAATGSIIYHKPTAGTTYATVKGIKSGVDINDPDVTKSQDGGIIKLKASMLTTSGVSVSVPKTNSSATYTLELANGVPTSAENVTEWVTNKGTAIYKNYNRGSYSINDKGAIVYTAGPKGTVTEYATIKGASSDITATLNGGLFQVNNTELTKSITIGGNNGDTENADYYGFNFSSGYNNAKITGSAQVDTITAEGDGLTITGGKGNDQITFGVGSRAGNVLIYSNGDGDDVIANFQKSDSITANKLTPKVDSEDDNVKITFDDKDGKITLEDYTGDYVTINKIQYATDGSGVYDPTSSNVLLADNNYSMDAANLSSLVQGDSASYNPYDFDTNFSLTKEDKLTPQISYNGNDK